MELDETTQNTSVMSPPPKRFHPQPSPMRKHSQRVRNPFEAALAERLHLPLIASPSLFQRPATPQLSSTQFEWTIDEVSSIKPANVEVHETQFQDSPDPEYEAKAQLAISSYFKEHQIVPSPVNCSVRQQRIILAEINSNTPIGKPGRRIRDFGTQTALSLPVELPPALEEALRPYFQPRLAGCYAEDGSSIQNWHDGSGHSNSSLQSGGGHNVSMRRKLFDMHNIILWDENRKTHSPKSSQLSPSHAASETRPLHLASIAGKLSDSLDKSSSGLLSPILGSDCLSGSPSSPHNLNAMVTSDGSQNSESAAVLRRKNLESGKSDQTKSHRRSFLFNPSDAEELSPIYPTTHNKPKVQQQHPMDDNSHEQSHLKDFVTPAKVRKAYFVRRRLTSAATATAKDGDDDDDDDDEFDMDIDGKSAKFTPDRSSSPLHSFHSSASASAACNNSDHHATTIATESFHMRISRLAVNSAKSAKTDEGKQGIGSTDDTEIGEVLDDDDAMQVSQLSMQNSNLSNSSINIHCDTPTGKRRSASRKNLSQSFSANWSTDSDDDVEETASDTDEPDSSINTNLALVNAETVKEVVQSALKVQLPEIADFIAVRTINNSPHFINESQKDTQQQSVNFYRTDSGFNEMTTNSSTSNGLSILSQQDELSREAFPFKPNEIGGTTAGHANGGGDSQTSPYCSTPSKTRIECCLTTVGPLHHDL